MNSCVAYVRALGLAIALAAIASAGDPAPLQEVSAFDCGGVARDSCCCAVCSDCRCCGSCCREICCPKTEVVTEEKSCWNVNCEKVCVPAIRLPWEPGGSPLTLFNCLWGGRERNVRCTCADCAAAANCCETCGTCVRCCKCKPVRCGTVRAVHVLEEDSYDVKKCETTWEIKRVAPVCPRSCETGGDHCACDLASDLPQEYDAGDVGLDRDALMDAPLPPPMQ